MAVQPVIMPKLGAYTEDVLLAEWRVEEGAEVVAGSVVLEMETDKTTAEIEAETAGWLHRLVAAGEKVPIGTRSALVAETREEYDALVGVGRTAARARIRSSTTSTRAAPGRSRPSQAQTGPRRLGAPGGGRPRAPRDGPLVSPRARALLEAARLPARASPARSPARARAAGSLDRDVAAWAAGPVSRLASGAQAGETSLTVQRSLPLRGRRGTIADPHGLEPADRRPAHLGARARREAARRAARAAERRRVRRRGSGSRPSS